MEEQTLTKEEKLEKLRELGVVGKEEGSDIISGLSHAQFDYLINFNENKSLTVPGVTVTKERYDNELVKRRKHESENAILKKQVKSIAESLISLVK